MFSKDSMNKLKDAVHSSKEYKEIDEYYSVRYKRSGARQELNRTEEEYIAKIRDIKDRIHKIEADCADRISRLELEQHSAEDDFEKEKASVFKTLMEKELLYKKVVRQIQLNINMIKADTESELAEANHMLQEIESAQILKRQTFEEEYSISAPERHSEKWYDCANEIANTISHYTTLKPQEYKPSASLIQ